MSRSGREAVKKLTVWDLNFSLRVYLRYKHRNVREMIKTIPIFTAIRNLKKKGTYFFTASEHLRRMKTRLCKK